MIVLSNADVEALLPMDTAVDRVTHAMLEVSADRTEMPLRTIMDVGAPNMFGMMPGSMANPGCFGIKLVSLFPGNTAAGHSSHQGAMVLFEPEFGSAIAIMNAGLLTAIRTAAASAVATRELSRPGSSVLAIIGNGEQAEHHLHAMTRVRPIASVRVAGRNAERVDAFVRTMQGRYPDLEISGGTDVGAAVGGADVVCAVTAAAEPVLFGEMVSPGTHLNIAGASIPSKREIDTDLVVRSRVYVDYRASTFAQAGEVIGAIGEGAITSDHVCGEIGEVLSGKVAGRGGDDEITLYRSLGVAAQDLACAHYILEQARRNGRGVEATIA